MKKLPARERPSTDWIQEMITMSNERPTTVADAHPKMGIEGLDDALIERIWCDLNKRLPREQVRRIVAEVASGFHDATVTAFLPILVHRHALERLQQELITTNANDHHSLDEQRSNRTSSARSMIKT